MVRVAWACTVICVLLTTSGAAAADAPTLAISATGVLGDPDTIVLAVSNPSTRVDVQIPNGYAFPAGAPSGGHAFIVGPGGVGERVEISPLPNRPAHPCAPGIHDQVWEAGFGSADVFVFLTGRVMTVCPLSAGTRLIAVASKYWSTPRAPGTYVWRATTADGAEATATLRLPVRLTLVQTARQPRARLRARLTEDATPVAGKVVQLVVPGRAPRSARSRADGTAVFTLRVRRRTAAYAQIALGEDALEPHTLKSKKIIVRP